MMGLKDFTYFASWFVFFLVIIVGISIIITLLIGPALFTKSSKGYIFLLCLLYGTSLYGQSILVVAIMPNVASSATFATLFDIISYFIVFAMQSASTAGSTKLVASLLPNIAASFSVYNLFYFEFYGSGLNHDSLNLEYNNYTFRNGLLLLLFDNFLYAIIGLYLDQIIPSEFGVAKPWYFLCTKKFWCGKK